MALSDCPECWETPCSCGYGYKNWDEKRLIEMRDMFQRLIDQRKIGKNNKDFMESIRTLIRG